MSKVKDQRERAKLIELHKKTQIMEAKLNRAQHLLRLNVNQTHKIEAERIKLEREVDQLEIKVENLEYKLEHDFTDHIWMGDPLIGKIEEILWKNTSKKDSEELDKFEKEIRGFGYIDSDENFGRTEDTDTTTNTTTADTNLTDTDTQTTFVPPKRKKRITALAQKSN